MAVVYWDVVVGRIIRRVTNILVARITEAGCGLGPRGRAAGRSRRGSHFGSLGIGISLVSLGMEIIRSAVTGSVESRAITRRRRLAVTEYAPGQVVAAALI